MTIENVRGILNSSLYPIDEFQDWRLPELRKELFNRYFKWRVTVHDLDHGYYMQNMCENYSNEQKYWFAFCFGMTYRTPQAFAYTETFENINLVSEGWHKENWKRTSYGTDARYNKGHFFKQVESIRAWLKGKTFEEKFDSILVHDNPNKNFWAVYNEVVTLYKFGRMTAWITCQALYDLLGLEIDPGVIMLEGFSPNQDSSMKSIWNGLCAYENTFDKMVGAYGNYEVTSKDVEEASEKLLQYTREAEEFSGFKIDSFRKESIWCQYKRLFNEKASKEWPGHASSDATSRYAYYKEHWPEIDWSSFRKALRDQPSIMAGLVCPKWFNEAFGETGVLLNLHEMFDDMPNGYALFEINPDPYRITELWTDDGLDVPKAFTFNH